METSHVYCKWCVNSFSPANRGMQALLCHFTPVGWPYSNPCNCIPQLLPPLPVELGWGALVPKTQPALPSSAFGSYCSVPWNNHQATPLPKWLLCAVPDWVFWGGCFNGSGPDKGFLSVEMSLVTPFKHWEESQGLGNMKNSDVSEGTIWKEEYFFFFFLNSKGNGKNMVLSRKQIQPLCLFLWGCCSRGNLAN